MYTCPMGWMKRAHITLICASAGCGEICLLVLVMFSGPVGPQSTNTAHKLALTDSLTQAQTSSIVSGGDSGRGNIFMTAFNDNLVDRTDADTSERTVGLGNIGGQMKNALVGSGVDTIIKGGDARNFSGRAGSMDSDGPNILLWNGEDGNGGGPRFDVRLPTTMTVAVGQTAALRCRVYGLGNKTVSWLKTDSMSILSAGLYTYTSNTRYLAKFTEQEELWILFIKQVEEADGGRYECQVSSLPVLSFFITLTVVDLKTYEKRGQLNDAARKKKEPEARILGDGDIFVQSDSALNITCLISHLPDDSEDIRWFLDDKVLSYATSRDVSTFTTKGEGISVSSLIVTRLKKSDSGLYRCEPGSIKPATVMVHVIEGEVTSQLHTDGGSASLLVPLISLSAVAAFILILGAVRTFHRVRTTAPVLPVRE